MAKLPPGVQITFAARAPQFCPDCGERIINKGAHYEACSGPTARRCEARIPGYGHGIWSFCVRPWNHSGEHIYR